MVAQIPTVSSGRLRKVKMKGAFMTDMGSVSASRALHVCQV